MPVDYSLYLVTDRSVLQGRDIFKAVEEAIRGELPWYNCGKRRSPARTFIIWR